MLNKIIKELEASKGWYDKIYYHGIDHAISIIKKHESEFEMDIKLKCIEILEDTINDFDINNESDELLWQLAGTNQNYNCFELYDYLTNKPKL